MERLTKSPFKLLIDEIKRCFEQFEEPKNIGTTDYEYLARAFILAKKLRKYNWKLGSKIISRIGDILKDEMALTDEAKPEFWETVERLEKWDELEIKESKKHSSDFGLY